MKRIDKPAHSSERYQLFYGDSLRLLTQLADGSAQGLITDPPYSSGGLHASERKRSTADKYINNSGRKVSSFSDSKFNFYGDNKDQRAYASWLNHWLVEAYRILEDGSPIALFTDWWQLPIITDALQWSEFLWLGVFVWDKKNSLPNPGKFRQSTEFVVWGSKGKLQADKEQPVYLKGLVSATIPPSQYRHHQTEKPQAVMEELVQVVRPGGTVLDPFMGSGSTGVAALRLGRQFIGMEKSGYYQVACERLEG